MQVTPVQPGCSWTVEAPAAAWVRVVGASSGTGPGTITLQVDPVGTAARSTGVAVASTGATMSVLLSQAAIAPAAAAVDTRAPTMGLLKGTPARGSVNLVWPNAKDSQSGVSSYKVVFNQGSRPPNPYCATGTAVDQAPTVSGINSRLTIAGLSPGSRYTFRVCALDKAGNVATGRMWRGTASR